MSEFSLDDALSGQGNAGNLRSDQGNPGQNWNNPWGGQNPGAQGFPGQAHPGNPAAGQGQQFPGYPAPGQGQQYPGYAAPGQGPQYPGFPPGGQQYPGFPPAGGQQYPGGYPGFPGPGQSYPGAPTPGQGTTDPRQSVPSIPPGPQRLPCTIPLPGGCVKGMCLEIEGVPNGKRFAIDYKIENDIAFHINPRFDENPYVIVRNSYIGGKWGSEERQCPKFPFQKGQQFKLQVVFNPDSYKVIVNNENICQYKHRITNFSGINTIHIDGDLTISGARITMV